MQADVLRLGFERGARCALLICALIFVLFGLGACAWIDTKESQLALRPTPGRPAGLAPDAQLFRPGDQRWLVPVPSLRPGQDDQLALWWLPQPQPDAPALLYLHGTFRNLYQNLPKINALREAGFAVLAVDYRGWGESTAIQPNENSITADAARAWQELKQRQPDAGQRVIYGHSMGGAVAVRLASGLNGRAGATPAAAAAPPQDYAALVLESSFTRMAEVAAEAGWLGRIVSLLTSLDFNAVGRIQRVDAQVLILHGTADTTVPFVLGQRLRDAAPPGVFWVPFEKGTHSRLHQEQPELYQRTMKALIQRLNGPRP